MNEGSFMDRFLAGPAGAHLGALLGCFAAAALSQVFVSGASNDPLLWLPPGIAFAVAWRHGSATLLAAGVGMFAWPVLVMGKDWLAALGIVAGELAGLLVALQVLARSIHRGTIPGDAGGQNEVSRQRWLSRFSLVAVLAGAPLSALVVTIARFGMEGTRPAELVERWAGSWLIHALGLILVTPLVQTLLQDRQRAGAAVATSPAAPGIRINASHEWPLLVILLIVGLIVVMQQTGWSSHVPLICLAFMPAVAFSGMKHRARSHYLLLGIAVALMCGALCLAHPTANMSQGDRLDVLEIIGMLLLGTLFAQILQAVTSDGAKMLLRLQTQSTHDPLTGLSNEFGFANWIEQLEPQTEWLLIGISFAGQQRTDALIGPNGALAARRLVARQLRAFNPDLAARMELGRYALGFRQVDDPGRTLESIRRTFNTFVVAREGGDPVEMPATVVALRVPVGANPNPMLLMSTLATLESQDTSAPAYIPAEVRTLTKELLQQFTHKAERAEDIRRWVNEGRIRLFAQPIVRSRRLAPDPLCSHEVLVRLRSEDGRLLSPGEFLPEVEQAGMSTTLDRHVITQTFNWYRTHPDMARRTRKCSINLTGPSLSDPRLIPFIRKVWTASGIPAKMFCFEITESQAIGHLQQAQNTVTLLRNMGFAVSIDDFGTGFATYDYLKRFTVDEVKIDGSFIRNLAKEGGIDPEIVGSIIRIARRLQIRTVAEFVVDEETRRRVEDLGADFCQGYAVARPVPIEDIYGIIV